MQTFIVIMFYKMKALEKLCTLTYQSKKVVQKVIYMVSCLISHQRFYRSKKFTQAANIYGFGVIMSTGQRPIDSCQFNKEPAVNTCIGLRHEFASETPEYILIN